MKAEPAAPKKYENKHSPPLLDAPCSVASSPTIPVKTYFNAEADKATILSDNQNKSGIYKWKNQINDKRYIGSSINLSERLKFYYSNSSMEALLKRSKSHICSAILKHGRSNFSLEILEYCLPDKCLEREGFYHKKRNPEYNIAQDPTAPMSGHNHSEESKTKISDANTGEKNPMFGKNHSEKTKTIMSEAKTGENNPMYGKNHSDNTKRKISDAQPTNIKIEVTDITNNTTICCDSIRETARVLNIPVQAISNYFIRNQQKPYKGIYTFKKL